MTNGQNGLSGFERNGNLTCNCSWKPYSSCGPLNSWRPPIFGVPLKSKRGKAMRVVGLRVKALQKDESDNRLVGSGGVIEKEFEFKPSFGEYLKAMESVKTGREKNQVHKSNSSKLKDDLEGNDAPLLERDERSVKLRGFKDRVKVSKVMESDEFGENANRPSGEEDGVNAELDYRRGRIREFNHNVGGKESHAHANVRRKRGGATSNERWLRNGTRSSNSDLEDLNYRSYKLKGDLEESDAPSSVRHESSVNLRRFNNQEKVSGVMESDEFGDNGDGCSGQEDVVNAELNYRGGRIREFNHKAGGKVSGVHADFRRKMGGATSDGRWLRDHTSSMNSDSEDFNETKSMKTQIAQRSPMVLGYIESIDRTIGLKENLAHAKDSLDMFGIKGKAFEKENIGSGVNKMNGGLVRNRSQADKITDKRYVQKNRLSRRSDQAFLERGYGEDFEVERAAFKSFEQSNDVIGKTKVPMWKIEEKIQKLGNWCVIYTLLYSLFFSS